MLATEVRDPGVGLVTVTRTKVTGDLSLARVYWTIIGDDKLVPTFTGPDTINGIPTDLRYAMKNDLDIPVSPENTVFIKFVAAK